MESSFMFGDLSKMLNIYVFFLSVRISSLIKKMNVNNLFNACNITFIIGNYIYES